MAKRHAPKVDRQAMSLTKEQRLLKRIKEHEKDAAYYKRWWVPSLVVGLASAVFYLATIIFNWPILGALIWLVGGGVTNGFYWLYKYLREIRQMEKLQTIAREKGLIK